MLGILPGEFCPSESVCKSQNPGWKKPPRSSTPNSATSSCPLSTSRHGDSIPFQYLINLSMKEFFLISNLNLPWHHLRTFLSSYHLLLGSRAKIPLGLCQGIVESNKAPPDSPFLQAKSPSISMNSFLEPGYSSMSHQKKKGGHVFHISAIKQERHGKTTWNIEFPPVCVLLWPVSFPLSAKEAPQSSQM